MALTNTDTRYGGVTKTFHWLTALLILTAFPLGIIANRIGISPETIAQKAQLFSLHKTVGVAAFLVALARILWALSQPKPGLLNAEHRAEAFLAEVVHWMLYCSMLIVPLSGWLHHAATSGFAPILWPFGQSLPLVPKSESVAAFFAAWHFVFTKVLAVSILLHVAGALKHHVIDKDATLRRMWFGQPDLPVLPRQHSTYMPLVAALVIYAVAMGGASILGRASDHSGGATQAFDAAQTAPAAQGEVTDGPNGWTVTEGTLGISVRQFGSAVNGSFATWRADITFDPATDAPEKGRVSVEIDIASLTLGSVTSNALGVEFFDAPNHPQAIYEGPILESNGAYLVPGTLTLKSTTAEVPLSFTLTIEGDTAVMSGTARIDRRDFGIGEAYADEATVAFPVDVKIDLTATRGAQ